MAALATLSLLLLASSVAFATRFSDCDVGERVQSVDITYCDDTVPLCSLFTGEEYQLNITFKHDVDFWEPYSKLFVTLSPIDGGETLHPDKDLDGNTCLITNIISPAHFSCTAIIPTEIQGHYVSRLKLYDSFQTNMFCTEVEVVII